MTTVETPLHPGVWLRMPDARPDSPFAAWRQLVSVDVVGESAWALLLTFVGGPPSPFHAANLHLLELSAADPRSLP